MKRDFIFLRGVHNKTKQDIVKRIVRHVYYEIIRCLTGTFSFSLKQDVTRIRKFRNEDLL